MTTKIAPATPLPWYEAGDNVNGQGILAASTEGNYIALFHLHDADCTYAAHAANAYPRLVEALRDVLSHCLDEYSHRQMLRGENTAGDAHKLLIELGDL